jgi:hypothetical protein
MNTDGKNHSLIIFGRPFSNEIKDKEKGSIVEEKIGKEKSIVTSKMV